MDGDLMRRKANVTDVNEGTCVTLANIDNGKFIIGLTSEDTLSVIPLDLKDTDRSQCVMLFYLVHNSDDGSYILSPCHNHLQCRVDGKFASDATRLARGCTMIEIGDKILRFNDGRRKGRKLPQTPGLVVDSRPPRKPRHHGNADDVDADESQDVDMVMDESWDLLSGEITNCSSAEVVSKAGGVIVREITTYTDRNLSVQSIGSIFAALEDIVKAKSGKNALLTFLQEIKLSATSVSEQPDRPTFSPLIRLFVDLINMSVDETLRVLLWLELLAALSRVERGVVELFVQNETVPAILGLMTAFTDVPDVQRVCLEIVSRVVTYEIPCGELGPVHETGIELILRAMTHHPDHAPIQRLGCRCVANLLTSLYRSAYHRAKYAPVSAIGDDLSRQLGVVGYLTDKAQPVVVDTIRAHPNDIALIAEGKRFINLIKNADNSRVCSMDSVAELCQQTSKDSGVCSTEEDFAPFKSILRNDASETKAHQVCFSEDAAGRSVSRVSINSPHSCARRGSEVKASAELHSGSDKNGGDSHSFLKVDKNGHSDLEMEESRSGKFNEKIERADVKCADVLVTQWRRDEVAVLLKLFKSEIYFHFCGLVIRGEASQSLRLIEQPIGDVLDELKLPETLDELVRSELDVDTTLTEIDAGTCVAFLDICRYRSLAHDMVKTQFNHLLSLFRPTMRVSLVQCLIQVLYRQLYNEHLQQVTSEEKFIRHMMRALPSFADPATQLHIDCLRDCLSDMLSL